MDLRGQTWLAILSPSIAQSRVINPATQDVMVIHAQHFQLTPDRLTFQDVQLTIKNHRMLGPNLPYWYTTMPKEEKESLMSDAKSKGCFCLVLVRSHIGRRGRQLTHS